MIKNDKINIILALLIAIGMWSYVLAEVNPPTETQISGVEITFEGEKTLSAAGLVKLSSDIASVDVTVKGDRSDTSKVDKKDIKVTADLTGLTKGSHVIELEFIVPDSVEIISVSSESVTVVVDNLVTVTKDVVVNLTANSVDDKEPYITDVSSKTVSVTGAETNIAKVDHVAATLDVTQVGDEPGTFDVPLTAVDSTGLQVKGVYISSPTVSVSAVMLNTKTVDLEVPVKDDDNTDVERTYTVPEQITVKGMAKDLEKISVIKAETVDLTDVFESTEIEIQPILPDGVTAALDSKQLKVTVMVVGMETKQLTYNESDITIEGLDENMTAELEEADIAVNVKGKGTVIKSLNKTDFVLSVDVSGLEPGTHEIELKCITDSDIKEFEIKPGKITVNIVEQSEEEE